MLVHPTSIHLKYTDVDTMVAASSEIDFPKHYDEKSFLSEELLSKLQQKLAWRQQLSARRIFLTNEYFVKVAKTGGTPK